MASISPTKVVAFVSLFASGVWAQLNVAQCGAGYDWNRNSLGQDPCTIGSNLDASCRGLAVYNYPPLNSTQSYLPPRQDHAGDTTCDCNTVMYILYMACTSCQGGQIYSWIAWIAACGSVYISQYPSDIPQNTTVPHWAYYDITLSANKTYDDATMISIGRDPETTPDPVTTLSTGGTISSTANLGPTTRSGTNVGAIVGGVVGSIVSLTILAALAFFCMRRRRQRRIQQQVLGPSGMDPYGQRQTSMYGPSVTSAPFTPYNPSDPSTFPPQSPPSSATYTTPSYGHSPRGAYSGAPEL